MRQEDKRFWTEWWQAFPDFNLLLASSWMSFWFVSVVPKYWNVATFSNDSLAILIFWFCPEFRWRDIIIYFVFCIKVKQLQFRIQYFSFCAVWYCVILGGELHSHISNTVSTYHWLYEEKWSGSWRVRTDGAGTGGLWVSEWVSEWVSK
jgi:hypothetical protein